MHSFTRSPLAKSDSDPLVRDVASGDRVKLCTAWNPTIRQAELRVKSDLNELSSTMQHPVSASPDREDSSVASSVSRLSGLPSESAKLEELMTLLMKLR